MKADRSGRRSREGDLGREFRIVKIGFNYCMRIQNIYLKTIVVESDNCVKTEISKISKYSRMNVVRL